MKKHMKRQHHRRHNDDEIIDEVHIVCVPRFKTSDLSGGEWRVSYRVTLQRKGAVMYARDYHRLADAASHLSWLLRTWSEQPNEEIPAWIGHIERESKLCTQVGCDNEATNFYRIKRLTSPSGDFLDPTDQHLDYVRGFCAAHATRGDASREDCDNNYFKSDDN